MKNNLVNVNYSVFMENPSTHFFEINIHFIEFNSTGGYIDLKLPVWRSGRYFIFDFASGVQNFSALDKHNNELNWYKTDKSTWRIHSGSSQSFSVKYKIYANEFEFRTRGLDENHAFINGSSLFMYADELRKLPVNLNVSPYNNWKISTGLEYINEIENIFYAPDYDTLIDSPLEIGIQKDYELVVNGKKHILSFHGKADYDINRLTEDFSLIIKKNYEFWGKVPYEKYVFIIHCSPTSGGGTEHINSTVVGVKPQAFSSVNGYKSFLRLISHEFFHTWNVKQLKPAGLTPYNYSRENYTSELWIAEGGTSYYDGLMLLRCGLLNEQDFFAEITKAVDDERRRPGYRVQSVAESSFDAWVKFWRRNPYAYFSESDYYSMGSYVCMALDLEIRNSSQNMYSLDDVFKTMFERFPLDVKGYTNDDFLNVCEEFSGISLKEFFDDHVYGTKAIDWDKYLGFAGLKLSKIAKPGSPAAGLYPGKSGEKILVTSVLAGSPADRAGIIKGDEIIALDGMKLSFENMEKKIRSLKAGDKAEFFVFRSNKLMKFPIILAEQNDESYSIEKIENPTGLQKAIYEKWTNAKW